MFYATPDYLRKFDDDTAEFVRSTTKALHQIAYVKGSKRLFNEAITFYLKAMRDHNFLNDDDKQTILIAIHGLITLGNFPLARALTRLAFAYMTADELDEYFTRARRAQHELDCVIPF